MTMMPTLVSKNRTMLTRICPRLPEMFVATSEGLPVRIDRDRSPAARLVANWKTNAAPRYRGTLAPGSVGMVPPSWGSGFLIQDLAIPGGAAT
jgi:hypothetical protein